MFKIFDENSMERLHFIYVWEILLLNIETSEITSFFYNNFSGSGGGVEPPDPPPPPRTPLPLLRSDPLNARAQNIEQPNLAW